MYSGYTSQTLALRSKNPHSASNHFYFPGDRAGEGTDGCSLIECRSSSRAVFSIRGLPINPRFLYGYCLRQSTLIHWSPSSRFILGGSHYCRLTLRGGLLRDRGRRRQCACGGSSRVSESDGTFHEMLGLLAEVEEDCIFRDANELSEKEGDCGKLSEVGIRSCDGDCRGLSRGEVTSRDNGRSKNGSSSSYHLGSSTGGFGSSDARHRRVMEELSCEHGKNDDFAKTNVQVLQNYRNDARLKRNSFGSESNAHSDSRGKMGKKDLSSRKVPELRSKNSMDHRGREEFVREDCILGERESREQSQKPSRTSEVNDRSTERDSSYKKLYNVKVENREDTSISGVNLVKELQRQQNEIDQLRKNCQELLRTSETRVSNAKGASSSSKVYREDSSTTYANLVEELRRQRCEIDRLTKNYEKLTRISAIRESDNERASSSNKVFNTKLDDRSSTSVVHSVEKAREKNSDIDQRVSGGSDLRRNSQKAIEISGIHRSDTENATRFQRHLETRMKDSENSLTSVQVAREKIAQTDQQVAEKMDRSKLSQNFTTSSEIRSATGKTSSSQRLLETRIDEQDENSTSAVHLVPGDREQKNEFDGQVAQPLRFRKEPRRDERTAEVTGIKVSNTRIENREENFSLVLVQEAKENRKAYMSGEKRSSERASVPEAFCGSIGNGSSSAQKNINEQDEQTRDENYQGTEDTLESARLLEMSSSQYVGEFVDKLHQEISSSNELDIASNRSSETQREMVSGGTSQTATVQPQNVLSPTSTYQNIEHMHESPRQSSSRSETKGPADEMWDVARPSSQEPVHVEEKIEKVSSDEGVAGPTSAPTSTETVIVKRSGRSFWSYIADVVRKSWSPRSESHKSPLQPGTRSQSNESVGSETWFSGHEPDDDENEIVTKGRKGTPKESTAVKRFVDHPETRTSPATRQEPCEARKVEEITMQVEADGSTGTTTRRYASRSSSPVSGTENSGWLVGEKGLQSGATVATSVISSTSGASSSSATNKGEKTEIGKVQMPDIVLKKSEQEPNGDKLAEIGGTLGKDTELKQRKFQRNKQVLKEQFDDWEEAYKIESEQRKTEIGKVQMPEIVLKKSEEEPNRDKLAEIGRTLGKDTELKLRKFQRNKQVLREQFDDWEEAYKIESEQRKTDEFFMREALLEAKKAADMWEVPVGAVLVQNGKIIARGYNLVEELRDSTAHAEMICIREASNVLRTWRLVETTLYVTLEPCPMCAGAILQARIDAVVWGAPNRLLGADGSWVRLFPGGDEGRSSSDKSNQMAGPVHPFHPNIAIRRGILETECSDAMQQFFQLRRKKNKIPEPPPPPCLPISTHPTKLLTKMHDIFCMMFCL